MAPLTRAAAKAEAVATEATPHAVAPRAELRAAAHAVQAVEPAEAA